MSNNMQTVRESYEAFHRRDLPGVLAALAPDEFIESGERIVVLGTRRVTAVNGRSATLKFVHVWRFENGRAVTFEDHFDTAEMIRLITA